MELPKNSPPTCTKVGYRPERDDNALGQYTCKPTPSIFARPSSPILPDQTPSPSPSLAKASSSIRPLGGGADLGTADIEPELITNLFDSAREKRRPVRYDDLPPTLVHAILSAEDKRFFEHGGFDFVRIVGAAWADIRHSSNHYQGASTITMQVARTFFFSNERTWRRKLAEAMVAMELEQRFNKQQIFELYANEVYLGNRGSFGIRGFSEASVAYFGKDLRQLSLAECAYLAGIIRAPNYYSSADRHPERGVQARDRVLTQMLENKLHHRSRRPGRQARAAQNRPHLRLRQRSTLFRRHGQRSPARQIFRKRADQREFPRLHHAGPRTAARRRRRRRGRHEERRQLCSRRNTTKWKKEQDKKGTNEPIPQAQVALVALDPRTGEIKAVIGGRDYGQSQLNHALAHRQPGSVFKPFVYAAAFDNAIDNVQPIVTPATTVDDEPTTFEFDGKEYTPNNFGAKIHGPRHRPRSPHQFAQRRHRQGRRTHRLRPRSANRPSDGSRQQHSADPRRRSRRLRNDAGRCCRRLHRFRQRRHARRTRVHQQRHRRRTATTLEKVRPQTRRPSSIPASPISSTSLLKDVMNHGTAAGVRARGFTLPAAGKTGTSRDGWFAGFTSNLVCVIWIGFDDNRDLGLTGGVADAPIWADFMIRATALPAYKDVKDFTPPDGVQSVMIDPGIPGTRHPQLPDHPRRGLRKRFRSHATIASSTAEATASSPPPVPGSRTSSAAANPNSPQPSTPTASLSPTIPIARPTPPARVLKWTQTASPSKRKRTLYRRFLVSLGVRRSKIRTSQSRMTKETRHEASFSGGFGKYPPTDFCSSCP